MHSLQDNFAQNQQHCRRNPNQAPNYDLSQGRFNNDNFRSSYRCRGKSSSFRGGSYGSRSSNKPKCQVCDKYNSNNDSQGKTMVEETTQNDVFPSTSTTLMAVLETLYDPEWYPDLDTNLMGIIPYNGNARIKMVDGSSAPIQHIGNSYFYLPNSIKPLFLNDLMHVSTISKNLLSVSQFAKDTKVYFEFHPTMCYVKC
ncbi:hypothetical protein CR513_36227, partial [Mucuna pruriens]